MAVTWFCLGVIAQFILARVIDAISHNHAMKIGYDCDKCAFKCNGYHCYTMRKSADLKGDVEDGISDLSGKNSD